VKATRPARYGRSVARAAHLLPAVLLLSGCELREITIALPQDIIVAEVVLQEGSSRQTAYIHRTLSPRGTARVLDARVYVHDEERDHTIQYFADADSLCLSPAPPPGLASTGTCYVARGPADLVRTGARYTLRIEVPDRPELVGATRVPADFDITTPTGPECHLQPRTSLTLAWTASADAWVYVTQARFTGLLDALRAQGVALPPTVPDEPIDLLGLAIGAADTTIVFPSGFGLFDRADEALHPILVAIGDGLPAGVTVALVVAAADRNYVNWVRGGAFNPSGTVRVPSIRGGGTGVFGSLVTRRRAVDTGSGELPPCS
jgi:hypothetical protein